MPEDWIVIAVLTGLVAAAVRTFVPLLRRPGA